MLNEWWAREGSDARVHFLPEYYEEDMWSYAFLKNLGITQVDETPGQPPRPLDRLVDIGRQLAEYRAGITARAFAASQRRLRGR